MSESSDSTPTDPLAQADPLARPLVDFVIPAVVLAVLTLVLFFLPIDLVVEGWFYSSGRGGWYLKDADPLVMIYKQGLIPALCVVGGAVVFLLAGFRVRSWQKYRKVLIYLLLVMVIAPGLLVNALMKEGWGRPRPRQIEQFGGNEAHERVWEYDGRSYGKSFPSGHAAMGFYFFSLYFLMRREGRKAVYLWLGVALGLGALLGFTRMAQGGHFPSDVVWSAGVCYFVAAGLYYLMGLHRGLWYAGGKMSRSMVAGCAVAMLGVVALAIGIPYHEEKRFEIPAGDAVGITRLELDLELPRANLRVAPGGAFSIEAEAEGFGSPGSRLEDRFEVACADGTCKVRLRQEKEGFLATVEQVMSVRLPSDAELDLDLELEKGVLVLALDRDAKGFLDLELGEVDLTMIVPSGLQLKVEIADEVDPIPPSEVLQVADFNWDGKKRRWKRGENPTLKIRVKRLDRGSITFMGAGTTTY